MVIAPTSLRMNSDHTIERVEPRKPALDHSVKAELAKPVASDIKADIDQFIGDGYSFYEVLRDKWMSIKLTATVAWATLPFVPKIIYGVVMRNWKTTLTGVVGGILAILGSFGVVVPHEWVEPIVGIAVIVIGLFARDSGNGSDAPQK